MIVLSCTSDESSENYSNERKDIILNDKTRSVANTLKDFYNRVTVDAISYVEESSEIADKNVIISPLSTSIALSMFANGVDEEMRDKISRYLGVNDIEGLNELSKILLTELPLADNKTQIHLANSLWFNNRLSLEPTFHSSLLNNYLTSISAENFNNPEVTNTINNWCKDYRR